MGYSIKLTDAVWRMHISSICKIEKEILKQSRWNGLKFITTKELKKARERTFLDFMRILRFECDYNNEIISIKSFTGDKLGDEEKILIILAKYSGTGNYLIFEGENRERWMWDVLPDGSLRRRGLISKQ